MPTRSHHVTEGVVRREGEYWTITYDGGQCHLRDSRGLRLLAQLLVRPASHVPALELAAAAAPRGGDVSAARRKRSQAQTAEQARINVTRALKLTVAKAEEHFPPLGAHLRATIRTGTRCIYEPDPRVPIIWRVSDGARRKSPEPN